MKRPKEGTTSARIWDLCDELTKADLDPTLLGAEIVLIQDAVKDLNPATVRTQVARWKKANREKLNHISPTGVPYEPTDPDIMTDETDVLLIFGFTATTWNLEETVEGALECLEDLARRKNAEGYSTIIEQAA